MAGSTVLNPLLKMPSQWFLPGKGAGGGGGLERQQGTAEGAVGSDSRGLEPECDSKL